MNYGEAREYIQGLAPRGVKPGLDTITELCARLGKPQGRLCFVHIAGTNGKGSVGAFLCASLRAAGLRVGRFVSPAVGDYLEGFTIDEKPIDKALYARCADMVRTAAGGSLFPTAFEAETAIAFLAFAELMPDYVLLECGMGGALDATNVIAAPYASVITSISTDHTRFLGGTLAEIARQKCGIIKDNCPAVTCTQADEVMNVIAENAARHGSPLYIADDIEDIHITPDGTEFTYDGAEYQITLPGTYQVQNAALAAQTARVLGISERSIQNGLRNAKWDYRFMRIGKYILDGAHNEGAAHALAESIRQYVRGGTAYICGCFKDKDYKRIAEITAPYADAVCCVTPHGERGLDGRILCDTFRAAGADAQYCESIADAVKKMHGFDNAIIFGSLSILSEAKAAVERDIADGTMQ